MSRFTWSLFFFWAWSAQGLPLYYQFEHEVTIAGHHFSVLIVLPSYYSRNFGMLEEVDFELREQQQNPIPDEKIFKNVIALQTRLWSYYNRSEFLKGKNIYDDEFASFRGIERFYDGRSAIFAIVEKEKPGEIADVPFTLEAMVRMSSPVDLTTTDPIDRLFQRLLPFQLRALLSDGGQEQLKKYPTDIIATVHNRPVGYVPIFLDDQGVLGRAESEVICWQGAPLELKAWYHQPKLIKWNENGTPKVLLIDFVPDLLEIALMYGGFDRTGLSTISLAHDSESQRILDGVLDLVSRLQGTKATPRDIGIRAGEFWTEVIELPLANREREDFDMDLRLEFADPHFKGSRNHVLWTTRERLLPALSKWANKRPGAKLIELSRLIVKRRQENQKCATQILHPGVKQLVSPEHAVQAIGIYLK